MEHEGARTAEDRELDLKCTELAALSKDLVDRELALATLRQELATFQAEYLRIVGKSYAAFDDIHARMAEDRATRRPDDRAIQHEARKARERANAASAQILNRGSEESGPLFKPPAALQTLYCTVARKLHPDLASTDNERALRRPWMQRLDDAYKKQDRDALKTLLKDWEQRSEPLRGSEVDDDLARAWLFGELHTHDYAYRTRIATELVRVTRRIAHAKQRIDDTGRILDDLKAGDLHNLYRQYRTRLDTGRNLLDEMAAKLERKIAYAQWEGLPPRDPLALATRNAGNLPARGLADLERWQRIEERTVAKQKPKITATGAEEKVEFKLTEEQWDQLRPLLDRLFHSVRRELKPGQDLLREFIKNVKKALIKGAGIPSRIAKAAVIRWNEETESGRNVEAGETEPDQTETGSAPGAAAGGKKATGAVVEGGPGGVPPTGEVGKGAGDGTEGAGSQGVSGSEPPGGQSQDDGDGSGTTHKARVVAQSERSVVDSHAAGIGAEE